MRLFTLAVLIISNNILFAQNYVDILKVNQSITTLNKFKDSSNASTRIQETSADVTYPIKINSKATILTGVIAEKIQMQLFSTGGLSTVSAICLKIGANLTFNDTWSGTFVLLPKISSDLKSIGNKDFQVGAMAFMKRKISDRLNYRYGLYYNAERFGPFFVPIVGLYYLSSNGKFESTLMLPIQFDLNYEVLPKTRIGLNYLGQVRSYHLNNVASYSTDGYLSKVSNELYAYLKMNFTKSISLTARVGESMGRKLRVFKEGDKVDFGMPLVYVGGNRKQLNTNFKDGLIFQLSLLYRFNL